MPTTGQAVVIVMPTEEETKLIEKIGEILNKLATSWLYMVGWGAGLGSTSLVILLYLNRRGRDDFFFKWGDEGTAITAIIATFIILSVGWTTAAYLVYFHQRRCREIAELERFAQNPAVWATVEKLRRIAGIVGPLERFDSVLDRLQRPNRFTRRHLTPLLRSF